MSKVINFIKKILKEREQTQVETIGYSYQNINYFLTNLFKIQNDKENNLDEDDKIALTFIVNIYMSNLDDVKEEEKKIFFKKNEKKKKIKNKKKMIDSKVNNINLLNYSRILKAKVVAGHKKIMEQRKNIIIKLQRILKINSDDIIFYINISDKNDILEEKKFYRLIQYGKEEIEHFFTTYKIKKSTYVLEEILQKYQSFNYWSLININKYLYDIEKICNIYKDFSPVFNFFEKLNNKLKEKKMINENIYSNNIETFCSLFEKGVKNLNFSFENKFIALEKKIVNNKKETDELRNKIKKLETEKKLENDELRNKMKIMEKRLTVLEDGFNDIKKELKCPITQKTFISPVVDKSGMTYEENSIKNRMIKKSSNVPINKNNLSNVSFYPNLTLKKIILIVNKIKL